jgi:Ca2+/Na+ antiporter
MTRNCEICGRRLITGRKYCYEHKRSTDAGSKKKNFLLIVIILFFLTWVIQRWISNNPLIAFVFLILVLTLTLLYLRKRHYLDFIIDKEHNYTSSERYVRIFFYSYALFLIFTFFAVPLSLSFIKVILLILAISSFIIGTYFIIRLLIIKFKEWFV